MLAEERRFRIREMLSRQRTITASDLCAAMGVTAVTVRRDLAALEEDGVLVRSHGGAVSRMSSTNFQPSYETLSHSHSAEKQAIARAAEHLVLDGETVFLEGSTTVYELARSLHQRNRLTVVTNSPTIVCQLQRSSGVDCPLYWRRSSKGHVLFFRRMGTACALRDSVGQSDSGSERNRSFVWSFNCKPRRGTDQEDDHESCEDEDCLSGSQ